MVVRKTTSPAIYKLHVVVGFVLYGTSLAVVSAEPVKRSAASHVQKSAEGSSQEGQTEFISSEGAMLVTATAEEALKQQPGASLITSKDIEKQPPVNDLSEIIRKMPGVNLTGNSATGARGNNRQIDIRGMGPENTLILIDGVPVSSRASVRYAWTGERDTRGDTNWVPPEMVDHIDILRGPSAAHYGSGAMGGVVNIVTKRPTNEWHGSISAYTNQPEDNKEGATKRTNFSLSGPLINDVLTMRLYGNINKTDGDAADINKAENGTNAAGREGVRNRDINADLLWRISQAQFLGFDFGFSRQGNIYAGDTQYSNGRSKLPNQLVGQETNRMYRQHFGITHDGIWDWGQSKLSLSFEDTKNSRMNEGLTGGIDGTITDQKFSDSHYKTLRGSQEFTLPFTFLVDNTLTAGLEWSREQLNDPASTSTNVDVASVNGVAGNSTLRSSKNRQELSGVYLQDTIDVLDETTLIPGLRFDYSSKFGSNLSPSLNLSQDLGDHVKLKAGIARVFKTPNLYQSSEGYLLASSGNGCAIGKSGGCYLMGNGDLDPETSVNKDIGIQWDNEGYSAGLTYFRNDYKNKIIAGTNAVQSLYVNSTYYSEFYDVYQWENGGKAVTQGLEGNLTLPLVEDTLTWRTNATYMFTSKQKSTGNPLTLIPKYTVNNMLDWQVTPDFSTNLAWTLYGRQHPRKHAEHRRDGISDTEVAAYSVFAWNVGYDIRKNLRVNAGINNLFDKQLYRSNEGASTYNEPGRSYYLGMTASF